MRSLGYIACLLFPTPICQCVVRVWPSCMWAPASWQTSIQNPIPSPAYPYTPHTVVTWPKDTYTSIGFCPPQFSPGEARSSVCVQSHMGKEFWSLRSWTWLWVGVSPRPCGLLTQGREHLETNQPKVLKMLGPAIPTRSGACSRLSKSRRNHDLLSQTIAGHFFFWSFDPYHHLRKYYLPHFTGKTHESESEVFCLGLHSEWQWFCSLCFFFFFKSCALPWNNWRMHQNILRMLSRQRWSFLPPGASQAAEHAR